MLMITSTLLYNWSFSDWVGWIYALYDTVASVNSHNPILAWILCLDLGYSFGFQEYVLCFLGGPGYAHVDETAGQLGVWLVNCGVAEFPQARNISVHVVLCLISWISILVLITSWSWSTVALNLFSALFPYLRTGVLPSIAVVTYSLKKTLEVCRCRCVCVCARLHALSHFKKNSLSSPIN